MVTGEQPKSAGAPEQAGHHVRSCLGDAVAEMVIGVAACALFGGFVKLLVWGWSRHRASTIVLSVILASILAFGAFSAVGPRRSRGRLTAAAVVFVVAVAVWLGYVVTYCSCSY